MDDRDGDGAVALPCGLDCDDLDPVKTGMLELCTDRFDNDCDGNVDCADADCRTDADGDGVMAPPCGNDCDDADRLNFPGNPENCVDLQDNDCDGLVDGLDPDCSTPCP